MNPNDLELPSALIEYAFTVALEEAQIAASTGEVPVGAVVLKNGQVIGKGHNLKESSNDPTLHAEIVAIRNACHHTGDWRLDGCVLVSTLEPCPMCAGAILHARLHGVIYGALDFKWGAAETKTTLFSPGQFNHTTQAKYVTTPECAAILTDFFRKLR